MTNTIINNKKIRKSAFPRALKDFDFTRQAVYAQLSSDVAVLRSQTESLGAKRTAIESITRAMRNQVFIPMEAEQVPGCDPIFTIDPSIQSALDALWGRTHTRNTARRYPTKKSWAARQGFIYFTHYAIIIDGEAFNLL